jgi:hypothetical protein
MTQPLHTVTNSHHAHRIEQNRRACRFYFFPFFPSHCYDNRSTSSPLPTNPANSSSFRVESKTDCPIHKHQRPNANASDKLPELCAQHQPQASSRPEQSRSAQKTCAFLPSDFRTARSARFARRTSINTSAHRVASDKCRRPLVVATSPVGSGWVAPSLLCDVSCASVRCAVVALLVAPTQARFVLFILGLLNEADTT